MAWNGAEQIIINTRPTDKTGEGGYRITLVESYSPFLDRYNDLPYKPMKLESPNLYGYMFCAVIRPETDLSSLLQHGRIEVIPEYMLGFKESKGYWYPLDMPPKDFIEAATIDSFIGDIPIDGGDFLRFLILAKAIGASSCSFREKLGMLDGMKTMFGQDGHAFSEFIKVIGGRDALIEMICNEHELTIKADAKITERVNNDLGKLIDEVRASDMLSGDNEKNKSRVVGVVIFVAIFLLMYFLVS